ncbi:MAG TPA: ABC transporter [Clostridiales bacterium]|nr:ABC transporter [Clostridiales bacterium]
MSGGQMQRVAIARALVNNPDILLADEPTGALDTQTSVQIMEILKEISKEKLIIMVTHNADLAKTYSTRIVKLLDGEVRSDSRPVEEGPVVAEQKEVKKKGKSKTAMSFFTALSLSLNNLMTKKTRTFLTSFAGSIGIIGIALILALSNGIQTYIDDVQEDTLSSYPISIHREEADISNIITALTGKEKNDYQHEKDAVYANTVMYDLFNSLVNVEKTQNNLKQFKEFLERDNNGLEEYVTSVLYTYDIKMNIYATDVDGKYIKSDYEALMKTMMRAMYGGNASSNPLSSMGGMNSFGNRYEVWKQIIPGENGQLVSNLLQDQYELVGEGSRWPKAKDEVILVLDADNEITDITQYALGLLSAEKMAENTLAVMRREEVKVENNRWDYDEILGRTFKLILSSDQYTDSNNDGVWENISENETAMDLIISNGMIIKIVGIVRPNENATATALGTGVLAYTQALAEYIIDGVANSAVYRAQADAKNANYDIFTGLPFVEENVEEVSPEELLQIAKAYFSGLNIQEKAVMYKAVLSEPAEEELKRLLEGYLVNYTTREEMEEAILQHLTMESGMSREKVVEYLRGYSTDELKKMIVSALTEMILSQYKTKGEETINQIIAAPGEKELAAIKAQYAGYLQNRTSKIAYITGVWTQTTGMSESAVAGYLSKLPDSEIDTIADAWVTQAATAEYASFAGLQKEEDKNKKIALAFDAYLATLTDEQLVQVYEAHKPATVSSSTLEENIKMLGAVDTSTPSSINLYAATFSAKDKIAETIARYNTTVAEEDRIRYTDYVALIMSSITTIINAISYVLIAFVAISLVVSSIMIGIITYISVLERTKEIGILRAMGASKKDISRVFNAETLIIGFGAGAIGIVVTLLLCIPINIIIHRLTDIPTLGASLPWLGGLILVIISMGLTLIAGLIPSKIAAKKDPVVALRTE